MFCVLRLSLLFWYCKKKHLMSHRFGISMIFKYLLILGQLSNFYERKWNLILPGTCFQKKIIQTFISATEVWINLLVHQKICLLCWFVKKILSKYWSFIVCFLCKNQIQCKTRNFLLFCPSIEPVYIKYCVTLSTVSCKCCFAYNMMNGMSVLSRYLHFYYQTITFVP